MREQDSTKQAATTQGATDDELNLSGGHPIETGGGPTNDTSQPATADPKPPNG